MTDLVPCPLCGANKGYTLIANASYSWRDVLCTACDGKIAECRATYPVDQDALTESANAAWNEAGKHAQGLRDENAKLRSALLLASGALSMVSPCASPECQAEQLEWLEDAKKSANLALAKGQK